MGQIRPGLTFWELAGQRAVFRVPLACGVFPCAGMPLQKVCLKEFPRGWGGQEASQLQSLPNMCINTPPPKAMEAPGQNLGNHIWRARGRRKGERLHSRCCRAQGACGVTVPISLCFGEPPGR